MEIGSVEFNEGQGDEPQMTRHGRKRVLSTLAALCLMGLGSGQGDGQAVDVGRLTTQKLDAMAKAGYRQFSLDDRTRDIVFADNNVIYTREFIVFKSGGKLRKFDTRSFETFSIESKIEWLAANDGYLAGVVGRNLKSIDLYDGSVYNVSLSTADESKTKHSYVDVLFLYDLDDGNMYFNRLIEYEALGQCNVYGVFNPRARKVLWKKDSCVDQKKIDADLSHFRGDGSAFTYKNYIYLRPGTGGVNTAQIFRASTGEQIEKEEAYKKALSEIRGGKIDPALSASNFLKDSVCKLMDKTNSQVIERYMSDRYGARKVLTTMSCGNFATVLWTKNGDKNILPESVTDYNLSIIGRGR